MKIATLTKLTILVIFLVLAICLDLKMFFQSSAAVGIDGYYYVLQIDSFLNHRQFYFASRTSIVLYFLSFLALIFDNPILAVKIGAVVLQILLCLGVFNLIKAVTESFWLGFLGFLITVFSNLHFYLLGEFINQLGGLVLFVWCVWGIVKLLQTKNPYWLFLILPALFLAIFSHRSIIFLAFIISASIGISYSFIAANSLKMKLIIAVIFIFLYILPAITAWQTFFVLPDWMKLEIRRFPQMPFQDLNITETLMLTIAIFFVIILLLTSRTSFQKNVKLLVFT
ncbi:MAG TPA: hypothetical protein VK892_17715, partial [Pyrinomonadaceae bacterium]|nr:hypothetical protein [Pyrinomonadaceae bacterium]